MRPLHPSAATFARNSKSDLENPLSLQWVYPLAEAQNRARMVIDRGYFFDAFQVVKLKTLELLGNIPRGLLTLNQAIRALETSAADEKPVSAIFTIAPNPQNPNRSKGWLHV